MGIGRGLRGSSAAGLGLREVGAGKPGLVP